MQGVAQMFGRFGPDSGGDQHVAELLKRTYTKFLEVDKQWTDRRKSSLAGSVSIYSLPLPLMTATYNLWLSSLLWQSALVFTDGIIMQYFQTDSLPEEAYRVGDALCDGAAAHTRLATRILAQYDDTGRVPLSQHAELPKLPVNRWCYMGTWNACNEIVDQIQQDLELISSSTVPARMAEIHAATAKSLRTRFTAVAALRQDWHSTSMADNQMELTQELVLHTTEIFKLGQQLWAPYLVGQKFKEALQKEKSLDELDLGFDSWILTDPRRKAEVQTNAAKVKELIGFWESVSNKTDILLLASEVTTALQSGAIRCRVSRGYTMVPWQSQFLVIRPVTLGGTTFQPGQLCAYYPARLSSGEVTIQVRRAGAIRNIVELLGQV